MIPEFIITIDGVEYEVENGSFSHEPRDPINTPIISFTIPDPFGVIEPELQAGQEVVVTKNGDVVVIGILEDIDISETDSESKLSIIASNKFYKKLSNSICDSYDFIEDINDYGVTVSTWEYTIARSTNAEDTLQNLTKSGAPIDGFRPDEIAKALIGEKLLYLHDFSDGSHLLNISARGKPDDIGTYPASSLQVFRNPGLDLTPTHPLQSTPRLQLITEGETYAATGVVESVPFYNGDPNIAPMGALGNTTLRFYGEFPTGTDIKVEVTNQGGEAFDDTNDFITTQYPRTGWVTIIDTAATTTVQSKVVNYVDVYGTGVSSTYSYVEGSTDFGGVGTSLAYRITLTGDTTTTPYLEYVKIDADTVSDTGITGGIFETYVDTAGITGSEYFEGDFTSKSRLKALSELRFSTINPDEELSHFWDAWLDIDGTLNFKKERGSTLTREYSFENRDFGGINYNKTGNAIWKQCIAYGAGSGKFRTRIVSDEEYILGGLYSAATAAQYGDAAKEGRYEDGNAATISQLLRKARAVFKLHQQPLNVLTIPSGFFDLNDFNFDIGDNIKIVIPKRGINSYFPVEDIIEDFEGKPVSVQLGEAAGTLENAIRNVSSSVNETYVVRGPQGGESGLSGSGTRCDNKTNGVYRFAVSNPEEISKVTLKAVTVPFDTSSRAVNITGGTTADGATSVLRKTQAVVDDGVAGASGNTAPTTSGSSGDASPDVTGTSTGAGAGVSGEAAGNGAGVSGNSADAAPGFTGDTGSTAPTVSGTASNTQPAVSGVSTGQSAAVTGDTAAFLQTNIGNNPWPLNNSRSFRPTISVTDAWSGWFDLDTFNGPGFATDFALLNIAQYNDSNTEDHDVEIDIELVNSSFVRIGNSLNDLGLTYLANNQATKDADTLENHLIVLPMGSTLGSSTSYRLRMRVKRLGGTNFTDEFALGGGVIFAQHSHGDGTLASANHQHSQGTYVAANHGHGAGTYSAANHGHDNGTLASSPHGHADGTLSADSHTHADGTLATDSHTHADGTYSAASHPHSAGSIVVTSHQHDDGSYELTAITLEDLLGEVQVGYDAADGGTGTTIYTQDTKTYKSQHSHDLVGGTADLDFGIYHFAGDAGDPLAEPREAPVYGSKLQLYVDPDDYTSPTPETKLSIEFGNPSQSTEIDGLDLTPWLARDSNGLIKAGMHSIVVKTIEAGIGNTKGLAKIQFVPVFEYRQST